MTCKYILPSLSTTLGVLSAVMMFFIIIMFIYIRCNKHTEVSRYCRPIRTHSIIITIILLESFKDS